MAGYSAVKLKEAYSTFVSGVGSGSGSLSNGLFFKSSSFEELMFQTSSATTTSCTLTRI